jgi:hypothetical protein
LRRKVADADGSRRLKRLNSLRKWPRHGWNSVILLGLLGRVSRWALHNESK